jgi:hypothetical protein
MMDYTPRPRRPFFAATPPNMNIVVPELETPHPVFDPRLQPMHQQPHQVEPAPRDDPDTPPPVRSVLKRQEAGPADNIRRMRLR